MALASGSQTIENYWGQDMPHVLMNNGSLKSCILCFGYCHLDDSDSSIPVEQTLFTSACSGYVHAGNLLQDHVLAVIRHLFSAPASANSLAVVRYTFVTESFRCSCWLKLCQLLRAMSALQRSSMADFPSCIPMAFS